MNLFYPLTHSKWLKNPLEGFRRYVVDKEDRAIKKIVKKLTYVKNKKQTFLSEGDNVTCDAKVHVYKRAKVAYYFFVMLLTLIILSEGIINYLTTLIALMPGETGLLAFLARIPTAIVLTVLSIVLADVCFEILFHNWMESHKMKYNIPDTQAGGVAEKIPGYSEKNRIVFFIVTLILLIAVLVAIYYFAEERARVLEGATETGHWISPITLISLLLPLGGGLIMIVIKRNYSLILAYKAKSRYRRIIDSDTKQNKYLVNFFNRKRDRTIEPEIAKTHRRINSFKNYLESKNQKNGSQNSQYILGNVRHVDSLIEFKQHIYKQLPNSVKDNGFFQN